MYMLVYSVQIISRLDWQSKLQMITLYCGRNIDVSHRYTNMATRILGSVYL